MAAGFIVRDRRWVWAFLTMLGVVLATDYLFVHVLFTRGPHVRILPAVASADAAMSDVAPGSSLSPADAALTDTFIETLRGCFDPDARDIGPASYLERLEGGGIQSRQAASEEWHINRPNGRQEHVVLSPSDRPEAAGRMQLRLFLVEDEDARVAKPLEEDKALSPTPEYITSVVTPGDIFFHERKEELHFVDGASATAAWVNDRLHELEVSRAGRTMTCRERQCECHSSAAL